jgi:hypothetical protein
MLSAVTTSSNKAHTAQHAEVLHHGLTADRKIAGESRRRRLTSNRDPLEEVSSGGISESAENLGYVAHVDSTVEASS